MSPEDAMDIAYHNGTSTGPSMVIDSPLGGDPSATGHSPRQSNGNPTQQHSERVARQACEQLIRVQYGGRRV